MYKFRLLSFSVIFFVISANAQNGLHWATDANSYYEIGEYGINQITLPAFTEKEVVNNEQLTPDGASSPLRVKNFTFSEDGKKMLIYTNSKRVWRYETRGDYWVLNTADSSLRQVGKNFPASSLMFAKLSPDGNKAAYVSGHNLYVEDLNNGNLQQLTNDGTDHMINGTFDWVYEEEFDCRDGFKWSPDGSHIAYWKIDATGIKNFLMINNTDSIYSFTIPVEYPKVGEDPSACYLYVADLSSGASTKMNVPGDPKQHYIPRMDWAANSTELVIQQLNRKQNESNIFYCNVTTGASGLVYTETNAAWIDVSNGWKWLKKGSSFLWVSEKDGWRHIYLMSRDCKTETLLTKGEYDIMDVSAVDEKGNYVYFTASPDNATQQYLYRIKMDGKSKMECLSAATEKGTHDYDISPNGLYAQHDFSNANTAPAENWISFAKNTIIKTEEPTSDGNKKNPKVEFFQVTTEDGITMDGWMVKPDNFDSTKKYPLVFTVYTEPAAQTVKDSYGIGRNGLYTGSMQKDGYIYMSLDGRGTPAPKGAAWRKAIYKNVGIVNVRDQAMAAKKIIEWPFIDTSRVAVWGWSGGGSTTLNLMFQYGDIYKTGIAVAPVAYRLAYDNIYEERYMGLPQENREDYIKASAITYAKNLKGHLLVVHGSGDDNVHYQNTEMLVNELIKYNKQFQMMSYPNRSHGIYEGSGTRAHLAGLFTKFLRDNCAPGAR